MRDLTEGPIVRQLIVMAVPIAIGMLFQTLYFLVDLYFVAHLGDAAIAGVSTAGTLTFVMMALTQMLGVGTVALVSHAVGRKDQAEANLIFNQSVVLSAICGVLTLGAGLLFAGAYARAMAADGAAAAAGAAYLYAYIPGLALQFALIALGSALRGTGIVKPTMMVQMLTVIVNTILAPVLIAGWGTHHPLGTAGAGLATTIAIAVGVVLLWIYFVRLEHYVKLDPELWRPRAAVIRRIFNVGLPAGGEFLMMFVILGFIYWVIRDFGPAAQAGFGIGMRIMQALFLPVMALAFATAPVAGQNFGARRFERVRQTFWAAALLSSALMFVLTLLCQIRPEWFIEGFSRQPDVLAVGVPYLRIISWNFVANGLIFTCSGMFQALGNTVPSLLSSASRLLTFVLPVLLLWALSHFTLGQVWYLSVASVTLQALTSLALLQREFRRRLEPPPAAAGGPMVTPAT
ncbi:MAG TPA: MATE family efflux transporter [Steroidobacteraceae bacterium]|jgi:putative MATE family efflux protein|nr:MATE family efflux transporter [Steroidobacteraceae bacterium]